MEKHYAYNNVIISSLNSSFSAFFSSITYSLNTFYNDKMRGGGACQQCGQKHLKELRKYKNTTTLVW